MVRQDRICGDAWLLLLNIHEKWVNPDCDVLWDVKRKLRVAGSLHDR